LKLQISTVLILIGAVLIVAGAAYPLSTVTETRSYTVFQDETLVLPSGQTEAVFDKYVQISLEGLNTVKASVSVTGFSYSTPVSLRVNNVMFGGMGVLAGNQISYSWDITKYVVNGSNKFTVKLGRYDEVPLSAEVKVKITWTCEASYVVEAPSVEIPQQQPNVEVEPSLPETPPETPVIPETGEVVTETSPTLKISTLQIAGVVLIAAGAVFALKKRIR
jgi:hypothetical protein